MIRTGLRKKPYYNSTVTGRRFSRMKAWFTGNSEKFIPDKKPKQGMWVTVYTDASYKKGIGGYAYWIKSSTKSIQDTGYILVPDLYQKSGRAPDYCEMIAILEAVRRTKSEHKDELIAGIRVTTDSLNSINLFKFMSKQANSKLFGHIRRSLYKELGGSFLKMVKVKAHSGNKTKRTWLNDYVDKASKKARVDYEEKIYNEKVNKSLGI